MNNADATAGLIEIYARQLRLPTFNRYKDVVRHLDSNQSYDKFLLEMLKQEAISRQESSHKRKIKSAKFPYIKTVDELDMSRFEHLDAAFIYQLATCEFVSKRQNIVMIGNTGNGKTHLSIALGVKACLEGMNVKFYTAANLSNELVEAPASKRIRRRGRFTAFYTQHNLKVRLDENALFPVTLPLKTLGQYEDALLDLELWEKMPNAISTVTAILTAFVIESGGYTLLLALLGFYVGLLIQELFYSDLLKNLFPMFLGSWIIALPATAIVSFVLIRQELWGNFIVLALIFLANWF